jgi:hypothetical protein
MRGHRFSARKRLSSMRINEDPPALGLWKKKILSFISVSQTLQKLEGFAKSCGDGIADKMRDRSDRRVGEAKLKMKEMGSCYLFTCH